MIESVNNKRIKEICKLKDKKYRDESSLYLVETYHLVEEAYIKGLLKEVFVLSDNVEFDVKTTQVSQSVMRKLSTTNSIVNIIGIVKKQNNFKLGNKVLILDDIQDPGNLGAILRSSVAFNIDTCILSDKSVDAYNPKTIRASQGAIFNINIKRCDIKDEIINLKTKGYTIYGSDVVNGKNVKTLTSHEKRKFALIIGNEGNGIEKDIYDLCEYLLHIPISNKQESLNASVAASILLYEMSDFNE